MSKKELLSIEDILEKTFHIDARGYRMSEVDIYLDAIISDYDFFQNRINELRAEIVVMAAKLEELEKENMTLKDRLDISGEVSDNMTVTNVDLLRRLSELEKKVYKKD